MTKKIIILIVVVVAVLGIVGLTNNKGNVVQKNTNQGSVSKKSVDEYASSIGATDKTEAYYMLIGAKDGAKYQLDGKTVEIYEFDKSKVADGAKQLTNDGVRVRTDGNIVIIYHP